MSGTTKKKKNQEKSHIPFRLNLLFFSIFLLFAALIVQLGYLQIIQGDHFKAEVERTESKIIKSNVPRGEIYDAKHNKLVGNVATNAITYTRGKNSKAEVMAQTAVKLGQLIDMPSVSPFESEKDNDLSIRDLKDFYFAWNNEEMKKRVETHLKTEGINADKFDYKDQVELISDDEVADLTADELNAAAIYAKMNASYALSTVHIKNKDVTDEEVATVSENIEDLPGIGTATDWNRYYPEEDMLRSILGSVSSEEQGIPESKLDEYLAKGYSRNDRVGTSFIELQYEDVLSGTKAQSRTEVNPNGDIVKQIQQYEGQKGDNLVLSIDMDIQARFDQLATTTLGKRTGLNESVYLVALNPKNGDVIAMSGKKLDGKGGIEDDALGVFQNSFTMGSTVKPATVLAGYMDGVISESDSVIVDQPLKFLGSQNISSVFNRSGSISLSDIEAIERSSNVYMARLAMRMGGDFDYTPNQTLNLDPQRTMAKLRKYNKQFGLGSATGIDLPSESVGQAGKVDNAGQPLFNAFGQFDTYTPLQLAQYVMTVANGGTRYAPRLVKEIRGTDPETGGLGELKARTEPRILNQINLPENVFSRVHEGMYLVTNGSNSYAAPFFAGTPYSVAGKTGTAEAYYWGQNESQRGTPVFNMTHVGFAPYDDPEVAVAVVLPYYNNYYNGTAHIELIRNAMDAYFGEGQFASNETEINEE